MHPAARLISFFFLALSCQRWNAPGLVIGALVVLVHGAPTRQHWWKLVRRSRFLLLSLWLITAYSLPGDTWHDLAWLPSGPGLTEANLHVARLALLLGWLAWVLTHFSVPQQMAGLWFLLRPLARTGMDINRAVVRLSLVLQLVDQRPTLRSWRDLLNRPRPEVEHPDTLALSIPPWQTGDYLYPALALTLGLLLCQL